MDCIHLLNMRLLPLLLFIQSLSANHLLVLEHFKIIFFKQKNQNWKKKEKLILIVIYLAASIQKEN